MSAEYKYKTLKFAIGVGPQEPLRAAFMCSTLASLGANQNTRTQSRHKIHLIQIHFSVTCLKADLQEYI